MKTQGTFGQGKGSFGRTCDKESGDTPFRLKLLEGVKSAPGRVLSWLNSKERRRKLKEEGMKYGLAFAIFAIFIEALEHVVVPGLFLYFHKPVIAAVSFFIHWGVLVYTLFFLIASLFTAGKDRDVSGDEEDGQGHASEEM